MPPTERYSGPIIDLHPAFEPTRPPPGAGRRKPRFVLWFCLVIASLALTWLVTSFATPATDALAPPSASTRTSVAAPLLSLNAVEIVRLYAGGDPAITIDGSVANETGRQAVLEPLHFTLLDSSGMRLAQWTLDLRQGLLNPGGRTRFITDPTPLPASAATVEIGIGDGPRRSFALD